MTLSTERYHVNYDMEDLKNLEYANRFIDKMITVMQNKNCTTAWSLYGELSIEEITKLREMMYIFYNIREIRKFES